uniref:Uncharacterized protein n=1 Tax=Oryza rufipogon TaxID=4529 RepID=A0A0E0PPN5_ORYRU
MADTHGGVRQSGEKRTTEIESDEEEPTPQAVCCVDPANRKLVFKGKAKASVLAQHNRLPHIDLARKNINDNVTLNHCICKLLIYPDHFY